MLKKGKTITTLKDNKGHRPKKDYIPIKLLDDDSSKNTYTRPFTYIRKDHSCMNSHLKDLVFRIVFKMCHGRGIL